MTEYRRVSDGAVFRVGKRQERLAAHRVSTGEWALVVPEPTLEAEKSKPRRTRKPKSEA